MVEIKTKRIYSIGGTTIGRIPKWQTQITTCPSRPVAMGV